VRGLSASEMVANPERGLGGTRTQSRLNDVRRRNLLHAVVDLSWREAVSFIRWPVLTGLAVTGLAIVYRFASCRYDKAMALGQPATLLWIVGSAGFSFYVSRFSSYDKTYGVGAVVILLMWCFMTAYIILTGAELDTAIEHRM
jgi:membrane protein